MKLQEWKTQAQYWDFQGHRIAYWQGHDWEDESRPVLMLIHGFPTASWDWHRVWQPLSRRYRLLALDMLGFGFSAKPRELDYQISLQADLWQGLARKLGIREGLLLAHDYGDTVAQELLARDLERAPDALHLRAVALLNGGLFPETHRPTLAQRALQSPLGFLVARGMNQARFSRSFAQVFGPNTQPDSVLLSDCWQLLAAGQGSAPIAHKLIHYIEQRRQNRTRWVGALQASNVPLRLICGGLDPVSGAHMAARYRALIPQPDIVMLPDVGHYPQLEAADAVLDAWWGFVDTLA